MAKNSDPLKNAIEEVTTPPVTSPAAAESPVKAMAAVARAASVDTRQEVAFHAQLRNAKIVKVFLSPQYRPWFGERMPVVLNGIPIYFPVDGKTYGVPEPYAAMIHARRRMVDDFLLKRNRLAEVQSNFETYAGELSF